MKRFAILLLLLLAAAPAFAQDEESVFVGDSTNFTKCNLWCCMPSYTYCSDSHQCRKSENATWMGMCGGGDYAEWTTSRLDADNYTINVTAGCMAYGQCEGGGICLLSLAIDGRVRETLNVTDTNMGDKDYTQQNVTYQTWLDEGTHKISIAYTNDCFGGGQGDRNAYLYMMNITLNESPDLSLNSSEIWAYVAELNWTAPTPEPGNHSLLFICPPDEHYRDLFYPVQCFLAPLKPLEGELGKGEGVVIVVNVRNKGNKTAYNFTVRFQDDDNPEDENGFQSEWGRLDLAPNESRKVFFTYRATETRNLSFWVDSGKKISEPDELNNFAFKEVRVTQPPQPDFWGPAMFVCGAIIVLAILAVSLLVWRSIPRSLPENASKLCPRCGMTVAEKARKCPVCGKEF